MDKKEITELMAKIMKEFKLSFKHLVIAKGEKNGSLIFSSADGKILDINANDIKID